MGKVVRVVFPAVLIVALYYAVFGGEYSAFELRALRAELEESRVQLDALKQERDSLAAWADSLRTHDFTILRLAREQGMVGPNEEIIQFHVVEADGDTVPVEDGGR